ncbi:hypothetical protein EON65_55265 [archaeon]|nr:MAG: hypothetical protein EON65_55265 [archaeon]
METVAAAHYDTTISKQLHTPPHHTTISWLRSLLNNKPEDALDTAIEETEDLEGITHHCHNAHPTACSRDILS